MTESFFFSQFPDVSLRVSTPLHFYVVFVQARPSFPSRNALSLSLMSFPFRFPLFQQVFYDPFFFFISSVPTQLSHLAGIPTKLPYFGQLYRMTPPPPRQSRRPSFPFFGRVRFFPESAATFCTYGLRPPFFSETQTPSDLNSISRAVSEFSPD